VRRFVRKHAFALTLVAVVLGLVFLPVLAGRIVSPNDVYLHYDPWASMVEGRAQNPLIHDPPLSYYTLAALLKRGGFFDWNPFVGGGIPGVGSVASAMLSPFALLPAQLLPLHLFYSGMVILKVLVSFWFAYLWLREERLGKRGAAVGATVVAASGPMVVWWLWQGTNATALYPALLYACARIVHGKSNRVGLLVLLALSFLLSGFPATVAYGAWTAAGYLAWGMVANLRFPWIEVRKSILAAGTALLIGAPVLAPFIGFLSRTGYLEARSEASSSIFYPWSHLRSFVQPYWLGDPVTRSWIGDSALGSMNNFVEATVYLGLLTLPLALLGVFKRRSRMKWFFVLLAAFLVAVMFGNGALASPFAALPGLKFSPMVRLRVVLPLAAAFLAGGGFVVLERFIRGRYSVAALRRFPLIVALGLAADLGLFAAWFTPQIPRGMATPPSSETVEFLKSRPGPFRVAPTFPYLMPNSSQLVGLEDIRAHWGAERSWRELLRRIDPGSVDVSTVATFNSLRMQLDDPLLAMLNVRYLIEPPKIDILRYLIQDRTEWIVRPETPFTIGSGESIEVPVAVDDSCQAIALPFSFRAEAGTKPWLTIEAMGRSGSVVWSRTLDAAEAARLEILHVPVPRGGDGVSTVVLESNGIWATTATGPGGTPAVGCVRFPLILSRSFRDGRVFENLGALPRFYPTWEAREMTPEQFLSDRAFDSGLSTAFHEVVPIDVARLSSVSADRRRASVTVMPFDRGRQRVTTESSVPFLLVSSEKVTPELEATLDGEPARVHTVNTMFAALLVPEGRHELVIERRIGRGWWAWSFAGLLLFIVLAIDDRRKIARP